MFANLAIMIAVLLVKHAKRLGNFNYVYYLFSMQCNGINANDCT